MRALDFLKSAVTAPHLTSASPGSGADKDQGKGSAPGSEVTSPGELVAWLNLNVTDAVDPRRSG